MPLFSQASDPCPRYSVASAFFDGESLWWYEDRSSQVFNEHCQFSFDETSRVFTFRTNVKMCTTAFEITSGSSAESCPFIPYNWVWKSMANGSYELTATLPESIWPCTIAMGQGQELYHFRFKVYFKVPLAEQWNPKS